MGDMKTPDFDDLLAAFDIPDIDTNEAIHSGHDEAEAHIKPVPGEPGPPDHVLPHTDITAVSVIVKNTVCPEQLDALDGRSKDGHGLGSRLLQNGFGAAELPRSPAARSVEAVASSNGECWVKEKGPKPLDIFSHFSPDPNEDSAANLIDRARECKPKEKSLAVPSLSPSPTPSLDCKEPGGEGAEGLPPPFPQPFEGSQAGAVSGPPPSVPCIKKEESDSEEAAREANPKALSAALGENPLEHLKSVTVRYSAGDSPITSWPGSDPSLGSGASSLPEVKHSPSSPREPFFKPSSPVVQSPRIPTSPKQLDDIALKEEREALEKSMGSPQSMSSAEEEEEEEEGNTNDSPSSNSSRPLKVRIKTIKTSCGSITRTVTRVSSDSEPGSARGSAEQSSEDAALEAEKEDGVALEVPREKLDLSSPLKAIEGPKIVSVQLGNGTKIKGTVLPVSTIQNASSAMLIAASVAQQKSVVLPAKTGKAVTKNIINLVPQALPKADTRTNASPVTQTTSVTTTANQKLNGTTVVMVQPQKPSPTVAGTVISRSQSSLVEAFNKILNSKNLLPTYKPNLSPPADASLALPPFGYRCLECGDSFALEKSLARHYDRRSMRIEVTCNHCTKRLVFFNKCSLLLHAREHKDKGLVMQCSHLVMRPIALDQMIGQPDITPLVSVASFPAGKVAGVTQDALSAANGAPELPILPLSSSGSEQSNYSCFRCLECKEQCKDKAGLAAHFQQAVATGTTSSTVRRHAALLLGLEACRALRGLCGALWGSPWGDSWGSVGQHVWQVLEQPLGLHGVTLRGPWGNTWSSLGQPLGLNGATVGATLGDSWGNPWGCIEEHMGLHGAALGAHLLLMHQLRARCRGFLRWWERCSPGDVGLFCPQPGGQSAQRGAGSPHTAMLQPWRCFPFPGPEAQMECGGSRAWVCSAMGWGR